MTDRHLVGSKVRQFLESGGDYAPIQICNILKKRPVIGILDDEVPTSVSQLKGNVSVIGPVPGNSLCLAVAEIQIDATQLAMILSGISLQSVKQRKRYRRAA